MIFLCEDCDDPAVKHGLCAKHHPGLNGQVELWAKEKLQRELQARELGELLVAAGIPSDRLSARQGADPQVTLTLAEVIDIMALS